MELESDISVVGDVDTEDVEQFRQRLTHMIRHGANGLRRKPRTVEPEGAKSKPAGPYDVPAIARDKHDRGLGMRKMTRHESVNAWRYLVGARLLG